MALVATEQPQNVVSRVVQLPLVSSTYDMVSNVYINTKENHPYIKSVCEVAERSVKTITSVALTSAMPIIQKLEPQIAVANDLACKGLDKIEQKLPILHQPSDKVVASAKDVVTGAKDTVSTTIGGVVDKTKGAVHESVEMTKAVVNGSVNTVMESRVVKMVTSGVDTALTKSESLVDMYLPLTEEELAKEAMKVEGFDVANIRPSYYVRLGSLSTKLRKRAYNQALSKVKDAKQRSQEAITQLHYTVDLIEYARKNVDSANQKLHGAQEKLHQSWVEWKKRTGYSEDNQKAEHIESRTLAIARSLTTQLQTTCLTLVSSIQGLPQNIQDQAHSLTKSAADVYQSFNSASSFRDMSDAVLARSRGQLGKMKESMDGMMDYLVNNTALNWLVGPFYPRLGDPEPSEHNGDEKMEEIQSENSTPLSHNC
ncbi:perilipin-2 isoform X2 [Polypterus senegalus]|uniref:perilipin-2 isoform X2 n=1 Tax=Polypterus senegalus TaxID=55291 RepID=UPI001962A219|nr:perilipin-2 isoform X2 [Polypterus senegalus]